jgi:ribonuclease T1
LPAKERGYYREYTVPTPGSRDRGARRIIAGRNREYYYTTDHYKTFRRIRE